MLAVSCRPSASLPATVGCAAALGLKCCLSTTGYVWFVMPTSEPATFVPVIQTRIEKPLSASVGVYVLVVAPGICTQLAKPRTGLQRRHEYGNVIGGEPSQVPAVSDIGVST